MKNVEKDNILLWKTDMRSRRDYGNTDHFRRLPRLLAALRILFQKKFGNTAIKRPEIRIHISIPSPIAVSIVILAEGVMCAISVRDISAGYPVGSVYGAMSCVPTSWMHHA